MAQEFTINSSNIESKINQLLPSQGGFGAGVDFSASTMVIPIVDLTETAEGSSLRQDLQSSLSLTTITVFNVSNATSTLVATTGYYRCVGTVTCRNSGFGNLNLTDGVTTKNIYNVAPNAVNEAGVYNYDFIVFIRAGESLTCSSTSGNVIMAGTTRQLADIDGNLVNP